MMKARCAAPCGRSTPGAAGVAPRPGPVLGRSRRAAAVARQQETFVAVEPFPPLAAASVRAPTAQWNSTVPILLAAALSFGPAFFFKLKAESAKPRPTLEPWPEVPRPDADPRAYQLALARTRQSLHLRKMLGISAGEGEALEAEVLEAQAVFSI
ncbi:hypothetical protein Rsub_09520 [Raphidocelis subcapitata]|uniref:Uncharacterized protein n=1 Tax=Raphidocelis subcapitata TaxID=307507 RepID=A0A2V0PID3_9CHLO|nr:hypothetical protein Rsub_09520 [Raphidocelis subcapitata]|eukprot:GBF97047.1 hypothetical protein Rsub_09520 [Raphidocelis subcapitata]